MTPFPFQVGQIGRAVTNGDPYYHLRSLGLHCDGTNGSTSIPDNSPNTKTVTAFGQAAVSTAQSKFGTGSLVFDGSSDYIDTSASAGFTMGTGDFSISFFQSLGIVTGIHILADLRPTSTQGLYPTIYINGTDLLYFTDSADRITATGVLTQGGQHHVELSRISGTTRLFLDGTQVGSSYTDSNNYLGTRMRFGASGVDAGLSLSGYLDEILVYKGVGLHGSNFTSPATEFSNF